MANQEQLGRLLSGVESWNQWRSQHPKVAIDLQGANLKGCFLRDVNLSGADIRSANFSDANLTNADLREAKSGIQRYKLIFASFLYFFIAIISSIALINTGDLAAQLLTDDVVKNATFLPALLVYIVLTIYFILVFLRGFTSDILYLLGSTSLLLVISEVGALVLGQDEIRSIISNTAWSLAGTGSWVVVGTLLEAVTLVILSSAFGNFARKLCLASMLTNIVFSFFTAATIASETLIYKLLAIAVSCIFVLLGYYACTSSLSGDTRFKIIRDSGVAIGSYGGTQFDRANLTNVDFSRAKFRGASLRSATLIRTRMKLARNLQFARCGNTLLDVTIVRELAVTLNGQGKSYIGHNLKGIDLREACLKYADLTEADISNATLKGAILESANLTKVQAMRTQFQGAKLTGACLEAWNIDSTTQLEGVICDYVYLQSKQREKRPSSGIFAPGDFTKLFQEVLNTVDLIFRDGVDWRAFVQTFRDIQVKNGDTSLSIQGIENKGDGVVVIKVRTSKEIDKAKLHAHFLHTYRKKLKILADQYRLRLKAKDAEIQAYRENSASLLEIATILAQRPINTKREFTSNQFNNNFKDTIIENLSNQTNDEASFNKAQNNCSVSLQISTKEIKQIQELLVQLTEEHPLNDIDDQDYIKRQASSVLLKRILGLMQLQSDKFIDDF